MEVQIEHGRLVLTPVAVVPRSDQLSDTGRAKEAQAEEDIRHGRVSVFESAEALLEDLVDKPE